MKSITNFAEAHAALRPLYENARANYDLKVMRALMDFLGNPQDLLRVIHVAGTSGKTSTAYYISALLQAGGKNVGLTVSPHVDEVNERVQINGVPLSEKEFCKELTEFMRLIGQSKLQLSYFEVMVAFAYWEFAKQNVDYAVVEVGLGGLLDGTNVVNRKDKVCVITDIGLDHTEILGDTLAEIAGQKAGIVQPQNHVFMYEQDNSVLEVVKDYTKNKDANLHILPDNAAIWGEQLPLFQQRNLGLAVQVANFVRNRDGQPALSDKEVEQASSIRIPARMERFNIGGKTLVVDGSHNAQKLGALRESMEAFYPNQKVAAVVAFVDGPDSRWQDALTTLLGIVNKLIITSFQAEQDIPKQSVDPIKLQNFCKDSKYGDSIILDDPAEAFGGLLKCPEPVLLVAGSFYLLNSIRPLIVKQ